MAQTSSRIAPGALLGTWNDDPSDDFMAPDGTLLPADASPQKIHYEFGLKLNETVEVTITTRHNSSHSSVFSVKYFPDIEIVTNNSQNLVIRWRPTSIKKVEPVFIVTDSNNSSSELSPVIQLCPCQNGGKCVEDDDVQRQRDSGVRFIVLSCACPAGLTGQVRALAVTMETELRALIMTNALVTCQDAANHVSILQVHICVTVIKDLNSKMMASAVPLRRIPSLTQLIVPACIPIARCNVSDVGCQQVCLEDHGQPRCSCHKGYKLIDDNKSCV
ncbi:Mucin-4, partial [Desmophyllum pertusum]